MSLALDATQAEKAIKALYKFSKAQEAKDDLLESQSSIIVSVVLKKIPVIKKGIHVKSLPLKHGIVPEDARICLIVKNKENEFEKKLADCKLSNLTKVISLVTLRKQYNRFENRRQLASSFDLFLVDDRIVSFMPELLGSSVLGKSSKIPVPVSVSKGDLKHHVEKALSSVHFCAAPSATQRFKFSHLGLTEKQSLENLLAVIPALLKKNNWPASNVQEVAVRLENTPLLPIYSSLP